MLLTKEEKAFIRSYVKMAISKDWYFLDLRDIECAISSIIGDMDFGHREAVYEYLYILDVNRKRKDGCL